MKTQKVFGLVLLLWLPLVAAEQRPARRALDLSNVSHKASTTVVRAATRSAAQKNSDIIVSDKFAQAPGLVQICNFGDLSNGMTVWFLATQAIPEGSIIFPYMIIEESDGNQAVTRFEARQLDVAIPAGDSYYLPSIHRFSSFWPAGRVVTVGVNVVLPDGTSTFTIDQFPVFGGWLAGGLPKPFVKQTRLTWADGIPLLTVEGQFLDSVPTIALDYLVVPSEAVKSATTSEIVVDLSLTAMDLTITQVLLLTVGQDGFANSYQFRFWPQ